jgi:hypothetical protein
VTIDDGKRAETIDDGKGAGLLMMGRERGLFMIERKGVTIDNGKEAGTIDDRKEGYIIECIAMYDDYHSGMSLGIVLMIGMGGETIVFYGCFVCAYPKIGTNLLCIPVNPHAHLVVPSKARTRNHACR